jgi:hypothetical protein
MMAPVYIRFVPRAGQAFVFQLIGVALGGTLHAFRDGNASDHRSPSDKRQQQCTTPPGLKWPVTMKA